MNDKRKLPKKSSSSGMSLRGKAILFFSLTLGLFLIILFIFYLKGSGINILADQANYVSKDPGKAASNLMEHGNIKGQSGSICGIVRNQYNSTITNAKVKITGGDIDWSTQTDQSGQFCIPPLDRNAQLILGEILVGKYQLKVSAAGYNSETKTVNVDSEEEKELKFYLSLSKEKMLPDF